MKDFSSVLASAYGMFSENTLSGLNSHEQLMRQVWNLYMHTNALNPMMYTSLRR
jgi:hypothetical protein